MSLSNLTQWTVLAPCLGGAVGAGGAPPPEQESSAIKKTSPRSYTCILLKDTRLPPDFLAAWQQISLAPVASMILAAAGDFCDKGSSGAGTPGVGAHLLSANAEGGGAYARILAVREDS